MNSELIIDALEYLEDSLLLEADRSRINRKRIIYIRVASAMAACVLLFVIAGLVLPGHNKGANLMAGMDWRLIRSEKIIDIEPSMEPNVLVKTTETPLPETVKPTSTPASKPTETKAPESDSNGKKSTELPENNANMRTELPDKMQTEMPAGTKQPVYDTPKPSDISTPVPSLQPIDENWTTYIARNEIREGGGIENYVVSNWLMDKFVAPPCCDSTSTPTSGEISGTSTPGENLNPDNWSYSVSLGNYKYKWCKKLLEAKYIDKSLGRIELCGVNSYVNKKANAVAYSIKGVDSDLVMAVRLLNDSSSYMFINSSYSFSTFTQMIDDLNLSEYLSLDSMAVYANGDESKTIDSDACWNILSKVNAKSMQAFTAYLEGTLVAALNMNSELYGCKNMPMVIFEEGYVIFELNDSLYAFDVGEDAVNELINIY